MVAKPGAFCDAMVTVKKGKPTLIRLVKVNAGAMNSGMITDNVILFVTTSPPARATNTPTSSVATMAYRGATALATSRDQHTAAKKHVSLKIAKCLQAKL